MFLSAEWLGYWLEVYEGKHRRPRRRVITKFRFTETGAEILEAHYV